MVATAALAGAPGHPRGAGKADESPGVHTGALFSLDALGGGLVVQSLLAFWLFQRFDLSMAVAGTIFFWTGVVSAGSYLVAARLAQRIGLVNTMVFTHFCRPTCS
jgi:hypothetical protein